MSDLVALKNNRGADEANVDCVSYLATATAPQRIENIANRLTGAEWGDLDDKNRRIIAGIGGNVRLEKRQVAALAPGWTCCATGRRAAADGDPRQSRQVGLLHREGRRMRRATPAMERKHRPTAADRVHLDRIDRAAKARKARLVARRKRRKAY